jgi:hypothetical protein
VEGIRPIPMKSLPLLKTSIVAPILAKIDGCLYILPIMSVPSFILEVIPVTPTFFINEDRYDGPWDLDRLLGALDEKVCLAGA